MSVRIRTKQIIKLKFRGFPGPFAPYRPVVAQPNFLVIGALILFGLVTIVVLMWLFRYAFFTYLLFVGGGAALTYLYKHRWQRRLDRHDWTAVPAVRLSAGAGRRGRPLPGMRQGLHACIHTVGLACLLWSVVRRHGPAAATSTEARALIRAAS